MKRVQQGFTLIELMIVVAIIGILAAIAIPAYQDYTVRAKMTEAINAVAAAKTSISEYIISQNALPADATAAGIATNIDSKYVESLAWDGSVLSVTIKGSAVGGGLEDGDQAVVLSPYTVTNGGAVNWTCKKGADVDTKYLPANCRGS